MSKSSKFLFLSILLQFTFASAQALKGEPELTKQAWYFDKIQMFKVWEKVSETPDVPVAVIDMDFDLSNADLKTSFDLVRSKDFSGNNFKKYLFNNGESQHGTLVSAIVGADGQNEIGVSGISQKAKLIALNMAQVGKAIDIEEVFKYAIDNGAKVINCSFGYFAMDQQLLRQLKRSMKYALKKDVLIVASAGNSGKNNDLEPIYPASFSVEFPNVISVGASTANDERFHASCYGKKHVDLFAPGEHIVAPLNAHKYILSDGTSEAAPIVSGVAALLRQFNPKLTAAEVKTILMSTVDKSESLKDFSVSGGRVNAARALEKAK